MANWVVLIDQSKTTAPNFPRPASWWQDYLPLWFFEPKWWLKERNCWKQEVIISDDQKLVAIHAEDRAHAKQMLTWMQGSVLQKYGFTFCGTAVEDQPQLDLLCVEGDEP